MLVMNKSKDKNDGNGNQMSYYALKKDTMKLEIFNKRRDYHGMVRIKITTSILRLKKQRASKIMVRNY